MDELDAHGPGPKERRSRTPDAAERALQLYDGLCQVARIMLRGDRVDLRVTELANETWVRRAAVLFESNPAGHAYGQLCKWTRRTLIDLIREEKAIKRGGGRVRLPIDESLADVPTEVRQSDPEQLDGVLDELMEHDSRAFDVVSLHIFGGLAMPEVAKVLGISLATTERDWKYARAWLKARLSDPRLPDDGGGNRPEASA